MTAIVGDAISTSPSVFEQVKRRAIIDRSAAIPLWVQVKNALTAAIDHSVPAGSQIPSEQTLCGLFGVSRPVVREALEAIVSEGKLVKLARRGVFTAKPKENADFLTNAIGVFDDMTAKGHKVTTRTFKLLRDSASDNERAALSLPETADVIRLVRVYLVDGRALTLTHIVIPAHRAPDLHLLLREGQSVFGLLRSHFGLTATRAERWFDAVKATIDQAEKLGVEVDQPLIAIESLAYCPNGIPLEYYNAVYNPGVTRMHVVTDQVP